MNTAKRHRAMAALFLLATPLPACADDMTMVLPILAVPFLVAGIILASVLWALARRSQVRTAVLMGVFLVGALLTGIPGAFVAVICIDYVSSRFADIAIPYLIGFLLYAVALALAFVGLVKRSKAEHRVGGNEEPPNE